MNKYLVFLAFLLTTLEVRNALMAGGLHPVDLTDLTMREKINQLSTIGVAKIAAARMEKAKITNVISSAKPDSLKYHQRIVSAKSQVVAGAKYYIKIRMNNANCKQSCVVEECDLVIVERVWENYVNLNDYTCRKISENNKAILLGQEKEVEMNSNAQAALDHIMEKFNAETNSIFLHKVKAVTKVKKQLVGGNLYSFEFQVGATSCDKQSTELENCAVAADANLLICDATVLDRVWMNNRYLKPTFNCKNAE